MRVGLLICTVFWALVALALSSCGSSAGWRVSFGVAPVTAIQDTQTLKEENGDGK